MHWCFCVLLLSVLGLHGTVGLQCVCRGDCATNTCEGNVCFTQAVRNFNDGSVSRRWRCLPGHSPACNTTSNDTTIICCSHADYCNEHLIPSLPFENITSNGVVTTSQLPTTATQATAAEPTLDTPMVAGCYQRSPSKPETTVCKLTSSCYTSVRRHSNGSIKSFKQGCSKPNSSCISVNRNRKLKICCNTSLCNEFIPGISSEAPNIDQTGNDGDRRNSTTDTPTPVSTLPEITTATPPPPPTTTTTTGDPLAPDIGADTTPPPSTNSVTSSTPSTLTPPSTPSTTQTTPSTTTPTTGMGVQTLPSNTDPPTQGFMVCFCTDCSDILGSGFCASQIGCATVYTGDNSTRMCLTNLSICESVENGPRVECCVEHYCNRPPEINSVEDLPTPSTSYPDAVTTPSVSMTTASPFGSDTTTATTTDSAIPTSNTDAPVTPDTNTGTLDSLATSTAPHPHPQSSTTPSDDGGNKSDDIYFILTGVVCGICAVCMIMVVVACVYICRQYRVRNLTSRLCKRRTPAKATGCSEKRPSETI